MILLGFLRRIFSAICKRYLRPPEASNIEAQQTTAMIMSITSTGGLDGGILRMNTSIARPSPEIAPKPKPPKRLPIYRITNKKKNSAINIS